MQYKDEHTIDVLAVFNYITKQYDVFAELKCDKYLGGYGLVVLPGYRGRNIATELLKARVPFMKEIGLGVTSTVFTGIGSQTAAKKAGFEEVYAIKYTDLKQVSSQFSYLNTKSEFCKVQTLKIA